MTNEAFPSREEEQSVFNVSAAVRYVGNDIDLLRDLLALLRVQKSDALQRIVIAIENDDSQALREAAHRLKGMVGNFYSIDAAKTAGALEILGKNGTTDSARELHDRLAVELDILCDAVCTLITQFE